VFGVSFRLNSDPLGSWIDYGGYDTAIAPTDESISWVNLQNTFYWTIPINDLHYNGVAVEKLSTLTGGVVDTGTSLMHFDQTTYTALYN